MGAGLVVVSRVGVGVVLGGHSCTMCWLSGFDILLSLLFFSWSGRLEREDRGGGAMGRTY